MNAIFLNSVVSASISDARKYPKAKYLSTPTNRETVSGPGSGLCIHAGLCSIGDRLLTTLHEDVSPSCATCDQHSSDSAANTLEKKISTNFFFQFKTFLFLAYKNKQGIIGVTPGKHWQLVK